MLFRSLIALPDVNLDKHISSIELVLDRALHNEISVYCWIDRYLITSQVVPGSVMLLSVQKTQVTQVSESSTAP